MARKNPNEFEAIAENQLAPDDLWLVWDASAGRLKKLLQPILAKASALANYYTKTQSDARYLQAADISGLGTGDMLGLHNLSEITDPAEARANLELDGVDNTADLDKPVSTATQAALDLKLDASAYNDRFKGLFATLAALESAYPTAAAGDYAQVDSGTGGALHVYSWDVSDGAWVLTSSDGTGAANTDQLPEGSANLYFTAARAVAACTGVFQAASTILSTIAGFTASTGFLKFASGTPSVASIATADLPANITTYDIPFCYPGIPGADQKFGAFSIVTPCSLPASLTGSQGKSVAANPSADYVVTLYKNGASIGTVTFNNGASTVSFSFASQVFFVDGDVISAIGQATADSTLDTPTFTLKAAVS